MALQTITVSRPDMRAHGSAYHCQKAHVRPLVAHGHD